MKERIGGVLIMVMSMTVSGCSMDSEGRITSRTYEQTKNIDARRSLVVTEQAILQRFSLQRVMDQLATQSGVPGLTGLQLFQQLWDTQNPGPGLFSGAHCDDGYDAERGTLLNDFAYICREAPSEGAQATCDPFSVGSECSYIPIGLFNRFDMAPEDGSHCGEHRITFAKESGVVETNQRNLIIFEATLDNPLPHLGLKGCQSIVKTWSKLSDENDVDKRADDLEAFYFDGTGLVPPVLHIDHLGAGSSGHGQLRTNQFVFAGSSDQNTGWMLREFKLEKECDAGGCSSLRFVPVTTKGNPAGELFDASSSHPQAAAFRADFPSRVRSLLGNSIAGISLSVPDQFNAGQSASSGPFASALDYNAYLGGDPSELRAALELEIVGSGLSVENVLDRARAQTCAGCHRRSRGVDLGGGLTWPADLGFVHISEREVEMVDGGLRYMISEALEDEFLPARKQIMQDFLNDKPRPPASDPTMPLIGHRHHG